MFLQFYSYIIILTAFTYPQHTHSDLSDDLIEDEELAKPTVLETTNWINEHKYAAIRMPTHLVEMPPEDVAARLQDVGHVDTVMNSMIKLQDFTKYVSIAFIWPKDKPFPPHDEGKVSTLDAATQAFILDEDGPIKDRWVICGAHRVKAWTRCMKKFRANKKYQNLYAYPIICRLNDRARKHLQNWGDLDNQKNTSKNASYVDRMRRGRQEYERFQRGVRLGKIKPGDVTETRTKVKTAYREIAHMSDGGFTQLWTLCTKSKPVFSRMYKLFRGDVQAPTYSTGKKKKLDTFKKPKSATNFVHIGNIPDETLCQWMDTIIAGEKPCKWLAEMCRKYKAHRRVMKEVCKLVSSLSGLPKRIKWEECKKKYPHCCDKKQIRVWTDNVYATALKDKAPMSPEFVKWVRQAYGISNRDMANRRKAKEVAQRVSSLRAPTMKLIC